MLLNILQYTGQPSQQGIIQLKMSVVPRLKNASLDDELNRILELSFLLICIFYFFYSEPIVHM